MKRFSSAVNLFFLIFLLLSCSSVPNKDKEEQLPIRPEIKLCTSSLEWNFIVDGIQYCKQECPKIPLVFHLVKINLVTPNLELVCYPLSTDFSAEGNFSSKSPLEFARQNKLYHLPKRSGRFIENSFEFLKNFDENHLYYM